MTSTLRRQFLYNDEYQLKMRFDNVDNSICEALKEQKRIENFLFELHCEKDALIAFNADLSRKKNINRRFSNIINITRNAQRYDRDMHRLIEAMIIRAYNQIEEAKRKHPNKLKKLVDLTNKFSSKYIYEQIKKKDKRVLQRGEKALKQFISKKKYIFEHRDEDIKHNKTDSKTCREAYNFWHIKLQMD